MDDLPSRVVAARIRLERERLDQIEALRATGPSAPLLDRLAGDRISTMTADVRGQLDRLREKAGRTPTVTTFQNLVTLQRAGDRVAAEALDLATGALARHTGLDVGACEEADGLIRWLAGHLDRRFARPTIPGDEEALHRATDVIRRRVPDNGLWDLPVMGHEFGHVVAAGLQSWDARSDQVLRPVASWLESFDGGRRSQATELFCDLFATWALGPSYLCTLVFHRLDPLSPARASEEDSHPGDASRVYACQWALARMGGRDLPMSPFDVMTTPAANAWATMQGGADAKALVDDDTRHALNQQLAGCWVLLVRNLGSVEYRWPTIIPLLVTHLEASSNTEVPACSPADVLNAAWTARLGEWVYGRRLSEAFEQRARRLLRRSLEGVDHAG